MKNLYFGLTMILLFLLVGCNLPGAQATTSSPSEAFTQAAVTVVAELTQVSALASATPFEPTDTATSIYTSTPSPSNTPAFTPTNTPVPFKMASFVSDETYPDNTHVAPNQTFAKAWRIRNTGSCSWNSNYQLIFDHGNRLGVTSGYTQPLTSSTVNSGQMVDLSVNLTAPSASGTYTGYWRLRDPGGVLFGITPAGGTFLVKVIVIANTTVTLSPVATESGSVGSDGTIYPGDINVGDSVDNHSIQAFVSYDISINPSSVTIIQIKDNFKSYTTGGNPFGNLGLLKGYKLNYTTPLIPADYIS